MVAELLPTRLWFPSVDYTLLVLFGCFAGTSCIPCTVVWPIVILILVTRVLVILVVRPYRAVGMTYVYAVFPTGQVLGAWPAYILASGRNGTLYAGVTGDLALRIHQHQQRATPGFTQRYGVTRLVWYEAFPSADEAISAEKQLTRASRNP